MLIDKIKKHTSGGVYPFHTPGHKRSQGYGSLVFNYDLDITEIHGFDDLHNMQGVLLETSKLAANLYGSRESFLLINGSTVGNLAAIGAHTKRGDKILITDNCHHSITNAAALFGLETVCLQLDEDEATGIPLSVSPEAVSKAIYDNPGIAMVIITSPSYEGVVSDIDAIADITHEAGAYLHVDCAHGAHFGFSDAFPPNPVSLGADTVVMSLHKTLPALTQCSLLHISSNLADSKATKRLLGILQTSSPSYVLMASIDYCLQLLADDAIKLFEDYINNLTYFKNIAGNLTNLRVTGKCNNFYDYDPGRIVISTRNTNINGLELTDILREKYKLELERVCNDYVIAITSICDTREGFLRLAEALVEIDGTA